MRELLLFLNLLAMAACTFPISFDECATDGDCPPIDDKKQFCTSDHLCAVGTPAERLCSEIYPPKSPANAIVVGALVDTGDINDRMPLESLKLGIDQVNQRRSGEPPLALHICELGANGDDARKSMQVLARQRSAVAVIGPSTSRAVFDVKDEVVRSGIPIMSYSATSPEISFLGASSGPVDGLFYRVAPSDNLQGPVLANKLPTPMTGNYALLFVDDPYGRGLKDAFIATVAKPPVLTVPYAEPAGPPDLVGAQRAVDSILRYNPPLSNVVAITNLYSDIIVRDLVDLPLMPATKIFMSDGAQNQTVLALIDQAPQPQMNQHLSRIYGTAPTTDIANVGGTGAYLKYDNDFKLRWNGEDPTFTPYAAYAYDAFYAVALAIGAAGEEVTPARVAQLLGHINRYDAVTHKCFLTPGRTNQLEVGMTSYTSAKDKLSTASGLVLLGASGPICFTPHGDRASGVYASWTIDVDSKNFTITPIQ